MENVAIVGSTYLPKWYRGKLRSIKHTDKIRGDLALETFNLALAKGMWIVIADGGSTKTFLREVSQIKNPKLKLIRLRTRKRSPNKRKAIFLAAKNPEIKAIVLMEFEKLSLVADCIEKIVAPIINENADVVVPKREESLFKKSYPDYMYRSEVEGNTLYNEELRAHGLLGLDAPELDVFFGPRVFKNEKRLLNTIFRLYQSKKIPSTLHKFIFDLEEYANAQFFPVVKALKRKKKVVSVTIPFEYPPKQKENETKGLLELFMLKRSFQRVTIIVELMHFLGYLDNHTHSRIRPVG